MNHCDPWSNSRGETRSSRKHAHGTTMNASRISQKTGMPPGQPTAKPQPRQPATKTVAG